MAAYIIAALESNDGGPSRVVQPVPLSTETDRVVHAELGAESSLLQTRAQTRDIIREMMRQYAYQPPPAGSLSDYSVQFVQSEPPSSKLLAMYDGKRITGPPVPANKNQFAKACSIAGMTGDQAYTLIQRTLWAVGRPFWPVVLKVYTEYGLAGLYEILEIMPSVNVRGVLELNSTGSLVQRATGTKFAKGTTLRTGTNWEGDSRRYGSRLEDARFDIQNHAGGVLFYDDKGVRALAEALS
jgi:hypothetical protein